MQNIILFIIQPLSLSLYVHFERISVPFKYHSAVLLMLHIWLNEFPFTDFIITKFQFCKSKTTATITFHYSQPATLLLLLLLHRRLLLVRAIAFYLNFGNNNNNAENAVGNTKWQIFCIHTNGLYTYNNCNELTNGNRLLSFFRPFSNGRGRSWLGKFSAQVVHTYSFQKDPFVNIFPLAKLKID